MSIGDEIFRVTGLSYNEGLAVHFGRLKTESLQDAERRFLLPQDGVTGGTNQDMWIQWLTPSFGPGAINDLKLAYWSSLE